MFMLAVLKSGSEQQEILVALFVVCLTSGAEPAAREKILSWVT